MPWDQELGLDSSRQSPALQPLAALAGTLAPFGKAEDVLHRLAGVRLSGTTCRRRTEEAGQDLRTQHAQGEAVKPVTPSPAWDFTIPDRDEQWYTGTVAYVGLDAFAVPTRPAEGPKTAYRMLYVGLVYDPRKKHTVYVSDFDHEAAARQVRQYACLFGLGRAETVVALTDGGNGLEKALRGHVSDAVVFVLDFYHAVDHLVSFSHLWHGRDSPAGTVWLAQAKELLRQGGGTALQEHLKEIDLGDGASPAVTEGLRLLRGYVSDNMHRMDYPSYRDRGWDIGSGPTEAGCKLLGGRLKGTGMRWCVSGSEQVAALRALYASDEGLWDAFWEQRRQKIHQRK